MKRDMDDFFGDGDDNYDADANFYKRLKDSCYKDSYIEALTSTKEERQGDVHYESIGKLFHKTAKAMVLNKFKYNNGSEIISFHSDLATTADFNNITLSAGLSDTKAKERDLNEATRNMSTLLDQYDIFLKECIEKMKQDKVEDQSRALKLLQLLLKI